MYGSLTRTDQLHVMIYVQGRIDDFFRLVKGTNLGPQATYYNSYWLKLLTKLVFFTKKYGFRVVKTNTYNIQCSVDKHFTTQKIIYTFFFIKDVSRYIYVVCICNLLFKHRHENWHRYIKKYMYLKNILTYNTSIYFLMCINYENY